MAETNLRYPSDKKKKYSKKNLHFLLTVIFLILCVLYIIVVYQSYVLLPEAHHEQSTFHSPHHTISKSNQLRNKAQIQTKQALSFQRFPKIPQHEEKPRLKQQQKNVKSEVHETPETGSKSLNEFPIIVHDNPDQYEQIYHPGKQAMGENINMTVPKFWVPPNKPLSEKMTLEEALSIGYKTKDNLETIFVSVASYRDYQCPFTVENIFYRAKHPERIRVAIIDQLYTNNPLFDDGNQNDSPPPFDSHCKDPPEKSCDENPDQMYCKYSHLIDYYEMDSRGALGPVFARHLGHRLYRGEYFAVQVDAHVSFVQDWDEMVINHWYNAKNEMAVLTVYLSDIQKHYDEKTGKSTTHHRPIMCNTGFSGHGKASFLKHMQQPEGTPGIHNEPTLQPYWAAGFSFARGHFVLNVPYDQYLPMVFQGEEISIGLRAFTYGYDFYTPEHSLCFHMYATGENEAKRRKVKKFWENEDLYKGVGSSSMLRLVGITKMFTGPPEEYLKYEWDHSEEDRYGLGKVRTVQKFLDVFGIHLRERKVENHLCSFAGKKMHNMFTKYLRANTMGIDYDQLDFRFVDPRPDEPELLGKD